MIKNIITLCIVFFFILSLSSCYFSPDDNELVQKNITVEQSDNITVDRSGKTIDTVDTIDVIQKITFPEAMLLGVNMEVVSSIV